MSIKIFSFFSGAGFLDLGFEKTGYDVVFANELFSDFAEVYRYSRINIGMSLPKYGLLLEDINAFVKEGENALYAQLLEQMASERTDHSLVGFIGGPPCPDFSVAGKNKGASGKHGVLSQVYMDLICSAQPDFFLFENVKGLWQTARHREFFESIKEQAQDAGYCITHRLVNALEYGAPQDRDRILMFGIKRELISHPESLDKDFDWFNGTRGDVKDIKGLPWPTVNPFQASGSDQPPTQIPLDQTAQFWFWKNDVLNHPNSNDFFKPKAGIVKMKSVEEGDVSRKSYKRLHRWRYSPTVAYGNNEVHLHPYLPRRLSVAEALSLQTLPKEFALPASICLSSKFKTIGNGVPFLLAEGIARTIAKFLSKYTQHGKVDA